MIDLVKKEKRKERIRKLAKFFIYLFCVVYYSVTACVPVYVFYIVYCQKNILIYSITVAFAASIVMDIVCSITEDVIVKIGNGIRKISTRRQERIEAAKAKKEEEARKLEKLLLKQNNYEEEIEKAQERYSNFKEVIKKNKSKLPNEIHEMLLETSKKIKQIIEVLEQDNEEYYPIRHTFTVYIPEFERMTYKFFDIVNSDSLDESGKSEYIRLVTEFNKYLDFVKSQINSSDKENLQISINSLIKIMEAERKKGTTL